jgi:hypothetical protein
MLYLTRWRRFAVPALLGLLALNACGCHWLTAYFAAERHPKKEVKAEYDLTADKLVIIPYASEEVLFNDSTLSVEISYNLVNEIVGHLGAKKVKTIVNPVEVNRWQESTLEWPNMSLTDMAKTFGADTVLYVELEHYSTIEERSANLYRGHVVARIQVASLKETQNPVYTTTVETVYPEKMPVGMTGTTEATVRRATNLIFANDVAKKFYNHDVEIVGGGK